MCIAGQAGFGDPCLKLRPPRTVILELAPVAYQRRVIIAPRTFNDHLSKYWKYSFHDKGAMYIATSAITYLLVKMLQEPFWSVCIKHQAEPDDASPTRISEYSLMHCILCIGLYLYSIPARHH